MDFFEDRNSNGFFFLSVELITFSGEAFSFRTRFFFFGRPLWFFFLGRPGGFRFFGRPIFAMMEISKSYKNQRCYPIKMIEFDWFLKKMKIFSEKLAILAWDSFKKWFFSNKWRDFFRLFLHLNLSFEQKKTWNFRLFSVFFTLGKRKNEKFRHESFLGRFCPERVPQKRVFYFLFFSGRSFLPSRKSVLELLGHPLDQYLPNSEICWHLKIFICGSKFWKIKIGWFRLEIRFLSLVLGSLMLKHYYI